MNVLMHILASNHAIHATSSSSSGAGSESVIGPAPEALASGSGGSIAGPQILTPSTTLDRLAQNLSLLRSQHAALVSMLDSIPATPYQRASTPLSTHAEETIPGSPSLRHSHDHETRRTSLATIGSGGSSAIWYDAPEEGLEFFSVDGDEDADQNESAYPSDDEEDDGARMHHKSRLVDLDAAALDASISTAPSSTVSPYSETGSFEPTQSTVSNASSISIPRAPTPTQHQVIRRTHLPAPTSGNEISLFSVLKKNVGKV